MASRTLITIAVLCIAAATFMPGCQTYKVVQKEQLNLVDANYDAVDCLLWKSRECVSKDDRILVASFVDLDDVSSSSTLGRMIGEVCTSRMSQRGYNVVNMKLRPSSVVITPQGEFLLSRDVNVLSEDFGAKVVLVGTYSRTYVGDRFRSVNQQLETADPALLSRPVYTKWGTRHFEEVHDSVYVSLRLVDAKTGTIMAAYDYRVPCDESVESLIVSSDSDANMRY